MRLVIATLIVYAWLNPCISNADSGQVAFIGGLRVPLSDVREDFPFGTTVGGEAEFRFEYASLVWGLSFSRFSADSDSALFSPMIWTVETHAGGRYHFSMNHEETRGLYAGGGVMMLYADDLFHTDDLLHSDHDSRLIGMYGSLGFEQRWQRFNVALNLRYEVFPQYTTEKSLHIRDALVILVKIGVL